MNTRVLPTGYSEIMYIDLTKQRNVAIVISIFSLVLAVATLIEGVFIRPFDIDISLLSIFIVMILAILYICLHEIVHGFFIRFFSGEKAFYGFIDGCFFAGSDFYYNRKAYIIIAMAPIVFWGIVLGVICITIPKEFFWYAYIVQIINISGGAGDMYVTWKVSKMHQSVMIKDNGASMSFFEKRVIE